MLEARQQDSVLAGPRGTPTIVVNSVFLGISWIAVLLRVYTRVKLVRIFYWEDWLLIASALFFGVYCGSVIATSRIVGSGTGEALALGDTLMALKLLIISESFYLLTVLVLKISIGLFFLRITVESWQKTLVYFTMSLSTIFGVAIFFFTCFQCGIYKNMLDFVTKQLTGKCISPASILGMTYTHAAITSLTDWIFVMTPIFVLRGSTMRVKEKWTVGALMMFASVSGIASLIRFKFISGLAGVHLNFFQNATDIAIWSCVEPGIGITAASIICLRPLFRKYIMTHFSNMPTYRKGKPNLHIRELSRSRTYLQEPEEAHLEEALSPVTLVNPISPSWPLPEKGERKIPPKRELSEGLPLELFAVDTRRSGSKGSDGWV